MITEGPVLELIDVELLSPSGGFVLGRSRLGIDNLGNGDEELQWAGYLAPATNCTFRRGGKRSGLATQIQVGTLNITLLNVDPENESELSPNTPIRVRSKVTGDVMFTGVILDIDMEDQLDKVKGLVNSYVTIQAVDAVQAHANTTRYGAIAAEGYERWEERIRRLSQSSLAPVNPPAVGASVIRYQL